MSKKGHPPVQKTPQEKKRLSLLKDRRNNYGENDKASRKWIPLRKAMENRDDRRKVGQALGQVQNLNEEDVDVLESTIRQDINRIANAWTKSPDIPLGEHIANQQEAIGNRGKAARRFKQEAFKDLIELTKTSKP
ncbi:MAG: hypothetical protein NVV72_01415 [Asticcacaulis sp.]|nr:hypothetical protein [Asticcacaulis sp.]